MKTGKEFVERYPLMFTHDKEWWAEQINALVERAFRSGFDAGCRYTEDVAGMDEPDESEALKNYLKEDV